MPRPPTISPLLLRCLTFPHRRLPRAASIRHVLLRTSPSTPRALATAAFETSTTTPSPALGELQKNSKRELRARHKQKPTSTFPPDWRVTCGLEIHAQLNTTHKLFSPLSPVLTTAPPNSCISPIDASLPGTQPRLNPRILLRALQAALVLHCEVQPHSRFDRKHYFYWDQPAGYQLTQFYSPLAKRGSLTLTPADGVEEELTLGITQVQIEQDTGKTISAPPYSLVDLNRVGVPLVEIITDPFPLASANVAAKVVQKLQGLLRAVDACVVGMEWGGLRADVNISVAREGEGLGQRCEIKNLSSFKAVEEAVAAEARRQIAIREDGGVVEGETRGWDPEKGETHRLRGKEGVVDYRFMPEPDLAAVVIEKDVVEKVRGIMPPLPEEMVEVLVGEYGLSDKDARTVLALDDGRTAHPSGVVAYVRKTTDTLVERVKGKKRKEVGKIVGNWVLMELGGHLTKSELSWQQNPVDRERLTDLLQTLLEGGITGAAAKKLLPMLMTSTNSVADIIEREQLGIKPLSDEEMMGYVQAVLDTKQGANVVEQFKATKEAPKKSDEKKKKGLRGFVVGSVMRELRGRAQAQQVEAAVDKVLGEL